MTKKVGVDVDAVVFESWRRMASKFVVRDLELSLAQDTRVRAGVLSMDIFFYLVSPERHHFLQRHHLRYPLS